jgi:hypothetical protein
MSGDQCSVFVKPVFDGWGRGFGEYAEGVALRSEGCGRRGGRSFALECNHVAVKNPHLLDNSLPLPEGEEQGTAHEKTLPGLATRERFVRCFRASDLGKVRREPHPPWSTSRLARRPRRGLSCLRRLRRSRTDLRRVARSARRAARSGGKTGRHARWR